MDTDRTVRWRSWSGTIENARANSMKQRKWKAPETFLETEPGVFTNNKYRVTKVLRKVRDVDCVLLMISSSDGLARHDWRDMQWIKNELVGPETEGIEIYPAESRLYDPSNQYILYVFNKIPIGIFEGRCVIDADRAVSPQRGLA